MSLRKFNIELQSQVLMQFNNLYLKTQRGLGESSPCEWKINEQCIKKRETSVSQRLINFALQMYKQLTSEQRYTISVLLQNRTKQKEITEAINVSTSTVSREIRRNSGVRRHYNWETAQANAVQTRRRKPGNRSVDKDVMEEAKRLLVTEQWSTRTNIWCIRLRTANDICCL